MKSHLSGVRDFGTEICPKVPETVQFAALEAIGAPNKTATSMTSLNNIDGETEIISTSAPNKKAKTLHQPAAILGLCYKDKNAVDKLLAKFIISNNLPLDVSKAPFLVDLLKSIAEFGPTYELLKYLALKSQSLTDVTNEIEEYIGNVKRFFTRTGCTLVMSKVMKNSELVCINFFAYSPGGLVYIDKIKIPEEGVAFQLFINRIYRIIKSLGPEHVFQCIIDDSEDRMVESFIDFEDDDFFSSVMKMILRKHPRIYLSRCASGEVGVLLVLTYLGVPWIHKTTQMTKLISKYLYRHDVDLLPRRGRTRNRQFDRSGLTKIAIELSVPCSILEIEKGLKALQLPIATSSSEQEASSSICDNVVAEVEVVYRAIHSTEFWSNGKKVVQVLQPLFQVLELVDCNGSTFGYLYEAMKKVEEAFKQHCEGDEGISKVFEGWRSRITNPMHAAAAFLSPVYMCSQNFTEDNEIQKGLELLTILVLIEEQEALLKQMHLYRMKVSDLFTPTAMEI